MGLANFVLKMLRSPSIFDVEVTRRRITGATGGFGEIYLSSGLRVNPAEMEELDDLRRLVECDVLI